MDKEIIKHLVADNIKYYREANNITQKQLADKLNVKHNTVSSWESGTNSIDIEILFKICDYIGVSVSDIYKDNKNSDNLILSSKEREIILSYRKKTSAQQYVDRLLDIEISNELSKGNSLKKA